MTTVARHGTVLVVGAGGIGGPAALALAGTDVATIRLVDPDVVDTSNLSRQILYEDADVGSAKATVAARRLEGAGPRVEGRVGRFDETSAPGLLEGVDVVIDATDGAATKDLVSALVVEAGIPLVHAAAIGSEGRVLDGPAGGRPCIACLFGYASESGEAAGDTCARVGVWPAVPGAVGALAADAAMRRLEDPRAPSGGLVVLDFASPRALVLAAQPDPACPACGAKRRRPRPVADACGVGGPSSHAAAPAGVLDLRGESCPMNLLRARRAIDRMPPGGVLEIWLGAEGMQTVPGGLTTLGHAVLDSAPRGDGLHLVVRRRGGEAGARPAPDGDAWLRRFARQIVLPDLGEEGQRRIGGARVVVAGDGDAAEAAATHLRAAGALDVVRGPGPTTGRLRIAAGPVSVDAPVRPSGPLARFEGAALADASLRAIVRGEPPTRRIAVDGAGRVSTVDS